MSLQPNPNRTGNLITISNSLPENQLTESYSNQGTLVVTGSSTIITNRSTFSTSSSDTSAVVKVAKGAELINSGTFSNTKNGSIDITSGTFSNKGHLELMNDGNSFNNSIGSLLRNGKTGSIYVGPDAWLYNYGTVNNEGAIDYWGGINTVDGVFHNQPGATLTPRNGGKMVGNVYNQGVHAIKNSEYSPQIKGDYEHSSGTFLVELDTKQLKNLTTDTC